MDINSKKIEQVLPIVFKYFNRVIVLMWRLGMGKLLNAWPAVFGRIMVIKHTGRSSGNSYYTPVNYTEKNGTICCTSAFDSYSDWYLHLIDNPQIDIWLPDGWYSAQAEIVEDAGERLPLLREVLASSGFAALTFGIYPKMMETTEYEKAVENFNLVRITRQSARTGADGPGSLAWIWPLALWLLLLKKRRRS